MVFIMYFESLIHCILDIYKSFCNVLIRAMPTLYCLNLDLNILLFNNVCFHYDRTMIIFFYYALCITCFVLWLCTNMYTSIKNKLYLSYAKLQTTQYLPVIREEVTLLILINQNVSRDWHSGNRQINPVSHLIYTTFWQINEQLIYWVFW
jgi:hypothetical protein